MRSERGLSQETVALNAEIEPSWLSRIERGRHNPAWATVQGIAAAIGVQVSDLALQAERLEREHREGGQIDR
jgi:transcriptional regulator with XRE-family HTH domain